MARYERYLYLILELGALAASFALAVGLTFGHGPVPDEQVLRLLLGCMALIWVVVSLLGAFQPVERRLGGAEVVRDLAYALVMAIFGTLAVSYMVDIQGAPPRLFTWHFVIFGFMVTAARLIIWMSIRTYRSAGFNFKRIAIVGNNEVSRKFISEVQAHPHYGYKVMGIFHAHEARRGEDTLPLEQFDEFVAGNNVDQVYFALDRMDDKALGMIRFCSMRNVRVLMIDPLLAELNGTGFRTYVDDSGYIALLAINPVKYRNFLGRMAKRAFDLVFSIFVVVFILSWLFPVLAVLIKLGSPGPVLFIQQRTGLVNKPFGCMKFRTMRQNKDSDRVQARTNDPRITPLGRFLRKTNLDEMPQFINVLLGQMSVVGPRPHMLAHTEEYSQLIGTYMERLWLKPGITGLAQAKGLRGETRELQMMKDRVDADRYYIQHWSLWLDIYVIMLTVWNMVTLKKQGA